jgi:hypothetical protein
MRIEDGGFGNIAGNSFQVKQSPVTPSSVSGLSASTIEQMFAMLPDAGLVSESGSAHTQARTILHQIAEDLVTHAQVLQQNWSGTAATAALGNLQKLHQTAMSLAVASAQTGAVLSWMADLLPYYKNYQAPALSVVGHIEAALGDNPQDRAAQAVLTRFDNRLVQANGNLPSEVTKDLPTNERAENVPLVSGPGGGVAAGAAAAGAAVGGATGGVGASTGGTGGATGVGATGPGGGTAGVPGGSTGTPGSPPSDRLASAPGGAGSTGGVTPGTPGTGGGGPAPGDPGAGGGGGLPGLPGATPPGDSVPPGDQPPGDTGVGVAGDGVGAGDPPPADGVGPGDPALAGGVGPGDPALAGGLDPGDAGLAGDGIGTDGVVGATPGDTPVIGSDGMIGAGPGGAGGPGADGGGGVGEGGSGFGDGVGDEAFAGPGVDGGLPGDGIVQGELGAGGLGAGDSGATGFVGADNAAVDSAADPGGMGFPAGGGTGAGRRERERYRQSWMAEDADVWEAPAEALAAQFGG